MLQPRFLMGTLVSGRAPRVTPTLPDILTMSTFSFLSSAALATWTCSEFAPVCWSLSQGCCTFFFFWLHSTACGIFVPRPGIEPQPSAVKAQSPNHWASREFPGCCTFDPSFLCLHCLPPAPSPGLKHPVLPAHPEAWTAGQSS